MDLKLKSSSIHLYGAPYFRNTFPRRPVKTHQPMRLPSLLRDRPTEELLLRGWKPIEFGPRLSRQTSKREVIWSITTSFCTVSNVLSLGYVEVQSTMPAKPDGWNFKGAWPAIWMLGSGNGAGWPRHGEIDIVESVNGNPRIYMTTHSTNHFGGNGQHPPLNPLQINSDLRWHS